MTDAERQLVDVLDAKCQVKNHEFTHPEIPSNFFCGYKRKSEEQLFTCIYEEEHYTIIYMRETEWEPDKEPKTQVIASHFSVML